VSAGCIHIMKPPEISGGFIIWMHPADTF
jgi:hypothetical protein